MSARMVYTGLSEVVAGHLIAIKRDEMNRIAQVTVTPMNGAISDIGQSAVRVAAELLAQRAARFLGCEWIVREWAG